MPPLPPAPHEHVPLTSFDQRPSDARHSDVTSYMSSGADTIEGPSRWWTFATRQRPEDSARQPLTSSAARLGFNRGRALSVNWLPASLSRRPGENSSFPRDREIQEEDEFTPPNRLHLDLPLPTHSPQTLAQAKTPGWDTPWSPRAPGRPTASWDTTDVSDHDSDEKNSRWQLRKKRVRVYMLTNVYVPLVGVPASRSLLLS